jgi:hypothetical protein
MIQMLKNNKVITISLVLLIGIILQIVLAVLPCITGKTNTPHEAAVDFAKAYFMIDPSMSDYLSKDKRVVDGSNVAKEHFERNRIEAEKMGFGPNYMRYRLYHIETEILDKNDDRAKVMIKGSLKRAIRTIYSVIADLPFINIGKHHKIEGIIDLIKEDEIWKVEGIRKTSTKTYHGHH